MRVHIVFALALVCADTVAPISSLAAEAGTYDSPQGKFSCVLGSAEAAMPVADNLGPAGGRVSFHTDWGLLRVDVQEFAPKIPDEIQDWYLRKSLYESFYATNALPRAKQEAPATLSLGREHLSIDSKPVMLTLAYMPATAGSDVSTQPLPGTFWGAIEYTDGNDMFMVSVIEPESPQRQWSAGETIDHVRELAIAAFKSCQFP